MRKDRVTLVVIAKAPVAGRVKTRLTPPCTSEQAADLARAALVDTLETVASMRDHRRVLALDGQPGDWLPAGFEVIPQRGDGLDERLGAAFADVGGPALLVGMDTPQITTALIDRSLGLLCSPGVDAVLGHAEDGGWWSIGLRTPTAGVFLGVPMSTDRTGAAQQARLHELGLRSVDLPRLTDVDDYAGARFVAGLAPRTRFARAFRQIDRELRSDSMSA